MTEETSLNILVERLSNARAVSSDKTEPRFFQILSDVEKGEYVKAQKLIIDLFNEGYFDIRLIMYSLYADLLNQGLSGINIALKTIPLLVQEHWEKLYPYSNRLSQAKSSVNWFFSTLLRMIKRTEGKAKEGGSTPFWDLVTADANVGAIEATIAAIEETAPFYQEWEGGSEVGNQMLYLKNWAHELSALLTPQEVINAVTPSADGLQEPAAEKSPKKIEKKTSNPLSTLSPALGSTLPPVQSIESAALKRLKERLDLFQYLVKEKQSFMKISIVAQDIAQIIETFNPAEYFPDLFAPYYAVVAKHSQALEGAWENKESFSWNTLNSLYQIDIETFKSWSH